MGLIVDYIVDCKYKVHQKSEVYSPALWLLMFGSLIESLKCNKVTGRFHKPLCLLLLFPSLVVSQNSLFCPSILMCHCWRG